MKQYYVYIMTNKSGTLYTGVTNNLERRVYEHKQKLVPDFTQKYKITRLVYFEVASDVYSAITREKQIKDWRRAKKIALINSLNPTWQDLREGWFEEIDKYFEITRKDQNVIPSAARNLGRAGWWPFPQRKPNEI